MNDAVEEEEDEDAQDVADDNTVYIVEGGQICYGSKRAWITTEAAKPITAVHLSRDPEELSESF